MHHNNEAVSSHYINFHIVIKEHIAVEMTLSWHSCISVVTLQEPISDYVMGSGCQCKIWRGWSSCGQKSNDSPALFLSNLKHCCTLKSGMNPVSIQQVHKSDFLERCKVFFLFTLNAVSYNEIERFIFHWTAASLEVSAHDFKQPQSHHAKSIRDWTLNSEPCCLWHIIKMNVGISHGKSSSLSSVL